MGKGRQTVGRASAAAIRGRHTVRPSPWGVRQPVSRTRNMESYFDELYAESADRPAYIPFTMHPYIIGRPGRTLALRGIVQHMKKAVNLWFPTGIELAEWCLNHVFQAECVKLRAAAG